MYENGAVPKVLMYGNSDVPKVLMYGNYAVCNEVIHKTSCHPVFAHIVPDFLLCQICCCPFTVACCLINEFYLDHWFHDVSVHLVCIHNDQFAQLLKH